MVKIMVNHNTNPVIINKYFNAKNEEGVPYYKADDDEEDQLKELLKNILLEGQKRQFDVEIVCILIQGAIEESMLYQNKLFSIEKYKDELTKMITKIVT